MIVCNLAFNAKKTLVSKIYGYPIFRVGAVYALAQFVVGVIICAVAALVYVPYWIPLLLSIILLSTAAIGVIATDNTRDLVEQVDEAAVADTEKITHFQIDIAGIVDCCEDDTLKAELKKLDDALRFSDPVSNAHTKELEEKLVILLDELKVFIENSKFDEAAAYIKKISNALAKRNRICKVTKGS